MQTRPFGTTGLSVTPLGFGAMHLNDARVGEAEAGALLNAVLDLGVNLVDTARGYGLSEERIGRHLARRRGEFVLSTKVGYGIPGFEDWTYACVLAGVDAALARMRCGHLDIVHLHSCPLPVLERGEVIRALEACVAAGKVRVAAYAGDNAELDFALGSGRFASVQTSVSVCDQVNLAHRLPALRARGLGVIAKRPLAGAVWTRAERPGDHAEGAYWDRWRAMGLDRLPTDLPPGEVALRFAAHCPGVDASIAGTASLEHFRRNLEAVEKGPLPTDLEEAIRSAFLHHGPGWAGLI
ncbi:aldo/keto reductase [Mesoterricola silvestris]|uniref:Aldo/keto reductase n=1 Tax=Mesoterricola silvestris TaxID=2927979 RepID=A0AA48K8C5_9BACT|nr:aldo/keto reductase [Mesoterricola silvestris]BDU72126.1 aldo/keto reductase [Mesoterricola silvestris]